MKVLIVGPEFLPLPSVKGGAVETLIDSFINYNEHKSKLALTVYSPYFKNVDNIDFNKYKNCEFRYINKQSNIYKVKRLILSVPYHLIKRKTIKSAYYDYIIKDIIKKNELKKYDLIILENGIRGTKIFKKILNCKIILHLHNDYINSSVKNSNDILKYVDEVWTVSDFINKRVRNVNKDISIKTLYNGVDLEHFNNEIKKEKIDKFCLNNRINNNKFNILYSGRIMNGKGILELIKSFNIVSNKYEDMQLIVSGFPDGKDANDYYLKLLNESENNKDKILFTGNIKYDEMPLLYSIANVQVVPSTCNEAFGMTLVEGMSQGIVIIASNTGGIPEIINNKNGILVSKENLVEEIVESIEKVYLNKELKNEISRNAKIDSKKFSQINYCSTFEKYINEMVGCYKNGEKD